MSERYKTLAAFLRNQAGLADKHPHKAGPGSVTLNHEEALLCADAIEELQRVRPQLAEAIARLQENYRAD